MRRNACNATIARKLDAESPHIKLSIALSNMLFSTNDEETAITSVRKNACNRFTNAASLKRTKSQKLLFDDSLLKDSFDIVYVHLTHARQPKSGESFTLYQDAAAKKGKGNESRVTQYDKIIIFLNMLNTLNRQRERWPSG